MTYPQMTAPQGWQCPGCKTIYASVQIMCLCCSPNVAGTQVGTGTGAGLPVRPNVVCSKEGS